MKIYVDADACPVVKIVEAVAKKYQIAVQLLCDTNHILRSDYCEVVIVDAGNDSVDFALANRIKKGDIAVTQDYGVAAMVLSRGAYGIHQNGFWYTDENIESLLSQRHFTKELRRKSAKAHLKGPRKRTKEDDEIFRIELERLIQYCLGNCEIK